MEKYDIIIVGAGPAGLTASVYAARANMKTLLLDKLAPGGNIVNTNEIANYVGTGVINGAELAIKMFEQSQESGAAFDYRTVLDIEDHGGHKTVVCEEDNARYDATSVIIASGMKPRRLRVPQEENFAGAGISWCAICDGAQYAGQDVVVIGGGNSAVEESLYLAGIVNRLNIVTDFDLTADPSACDKLRAMPNVRVHPYQKVLGFLGDARLTGVRIQPKDDSGPAVDIPCQGVFEYVGLTPISDFCKNLGILNERGFIPVDAFMRTSREGIFAAGDITAKQLRQVATACGDGAIAAHNAAAYVDTVR